MRTATHILSIPFSRMCESEATQSCAKVRRVIRENLQGSRQNLILSIHSLKIENVFVALYLALLAFFGLFFTEGVVLHDQFGHAKKPKPKCVRVLHIPKLLLK